jgi:uncharacterized cofD-like protein
VTGPASAAGHRPAVVALGGGHGLSASLAAVRLYAGSITAIVSVADDGGSSGRLRNALGIPAPGDLRRCLVALGDAESLWAHAFEHRFDSGELEGHAVGNLVIAGLASATGDFTVALEEAGRLVGAVGRVLPASSVPVVLKAESPAGTVEGQSAVSDAGAVTAVSLVPPDAPAPAEAVEAIAAADQIVLGPGSLFTSVLATVAVPDIRDALASARCRIVYVSNLRSEEIEARGYGVAEAVAALAAHGVDVDVVVRHRGALTLGDVRVPVVEADVADDAGTAHDPRRLAAALADLVG